MEYRRNLPHFQPDGAALFITFRLYDTIPLASGRDGRTFVAADRELERNRLGLSWLKQPLVAECVTETIREGERVRALYDLVAFVVMPNHVHLLIDPRTPAPKITQFVKGVSARRSMRCCAERVSRSGKMSRSIAGCGLRRRGAISFDTSNSIRCVRISRRNHNYFDIRAPSQAEACATHADKSQCIKWWNRL